jgi:protein TonB
MSDLNGRRTTTKAGKSPYRSPSRRGPSTDPLSKVLSGSGKLPVSATVTFAVLLHAGMAAGATAAAHLGELFAWHRGIRDVISYRLSQYDLELVKEAPPPPPAPEEEPPKPEPEPTKAPPPKDEAPPPPPPPAAAGQVLTAAPDPNEPVDLTGGFVTGPGTDYAGGTTTASGTSKKAVYNPAATPTGVPGGTGSGPVRPVTKEDKSRVPGLLGSVDWNDCPFPGEADADQIDQAFVLIQVKVKADGSPESVTVLQDPAHGFGREARKCAMRKKYSQGMDVDGNPVPGTTKPFRVRFER